MSNHIIYGLVDPNTKELRYIGYTSNKNKRYNEHIKPSLLKAKTHKIAWIKSLLSQNIKPEIIIIEEHFSDKELPQAEVEMISYFKSIGCNLINGTPGGECGGIPIGFKHTEETKNKISFALLGDKNHNFGKEFSKETKLKMSKPRSELAKKNMSAAKIKNKIAVGENNPNSKLSYELVTKIREEYKFIQSYAILAKKYNVKRSAIAKIITFKTWCK